MYADDCTFTFERVASGKLLITIAGHDRGQFGSTTIDEIVTAIQREGNLELFIDARETKGVSVAVSEAWTRFFSVNRESLQRVHMLPGSEYVQLTVSIVRHLSGTGSLIRTHSNFEDFLQALNGSTRMKK